MTLDLNAPHWNLDQLYTAGSEALESDIRALGDRGRGFVKWRAVLEAGEVSAGDFGRMIADLEAVTVLAERLSTFAYLGFAQDTSDQRASSLLARIEEALAKLDNDQMFFELWWKNLPEDQAAPLAGTVPSKGYWLERTRAYRIHTLTEAEERIVNLKDLTGSTSIVNLYDTITNAYRFGSSFLPGGGGAGQLTREELMVHVRSHLPEVREGAYRELYRVYAVDKAVLGQIFQIRARDWRTEKVGLRGYQSPQSVRNKANDLSDQTVEGLLRVCRKKAPEVFGRYFRLKAKRLGLERLRRYDLYAPLRPSTGRLSFPEGLELVREAFGAFDARFARLAMEVARAGRLSAAVRPGKLSGAFCSSSVPGDIPWVLMSWNGTRQDAFTLAHELGHAVHAQLAADLDVFSFHSALPLAETASTFGEMLLADLLRRRADRDGREDLAFRLLDDAYATVGRQAFFALFEVEAHRMVAEGATPDELAEAYLENLRLQFGDSVEVPGEFALEWTTIPHFLHTPFYVYAYSFGQLLVYSLWRIYEREGPAFARRLESILAMGGSASPEAILAQAGVGPLDDDFWAGGFEVVEGFLP